MPNILLQMLIIMRDKFTLKNSQLYILHYEYFLKQKLLGEVFSEKFSREFFLT